RLRRTSPIRITKNDREEYARLVRNAKAKIRRTDKNYGVDLSRQVKLPDINNFSTRSEYNQWKQEMERFTNRYTKEFQFVKNAKGVVANKQQLYDFKKANEKARTLAIKKNEKIKNEPYFVGGKQEGTIAD